MNPFRGVRPLSGDSAPVMRALICSWNEASPPGSGCWAAVSCSAISISPLLYRLLAHGRAGASPGLAGRRWTEMSLYDYGNRATYGLQAVAWPLTPATGAPDACGKARSRAASNEDCWHRAEAALCNATEAHSRARPTACHAPGGSPYRSALSAWRSSSVSRCPSSGRPWNAAGVF